MYKRVDVVSTTYLGGWFDIFPAIGASTPDQETVYPQHGELLYLPWQYRIDTQTPERVEAETARILPPGTTVETTYCLWANEH